MGAMLERARRLAADHDIQLPGLRMADHLVERHGQAGLVVRSWTIAKGWDEPHHLDVAVAFIDRTGR